MAPAIPFATSLRRRIAMTHGDATATVADRAVIIEKGRIRWSDTLAALVEAAEVREQYLSV